MTDSRSQHPIQLFLIHWLLVHPGDPALPPFTSYPDPPEGGSSLPPLGGSGSDQPLTSRQHPGIDRHPNHLIATSSSRRPETYRESFAILSDEGLIPEGFAIQLSDLAGFRNVLIYPYCRLDLDEVSMVLQDDLPVMNRYRDLVREMLQNRILE